MNKALLRRAARLLHEHAKGIFDSCKGHDGQGFVCGDCYPGNEVCKRDHRVLVDTVKAPRKEAA